MAECLAGPLHKSGRGIAEVGIAVALSLLLAFFNLPILPNGGQVSLDMLPIVLLALMRGSKRGISAGFVYGCLHSLQEPFVVHPLQFLLDYPLAYAALGLVGLSFLRAHTFLAIISGVTIRFLCHTVSGVIFIDAFLGRQNLPTSPWLWAASYNCTFLLPSALVLCVIIPPVKKAMQNYGIFAK